MKNTEIIEYECAIRNLDPENVKTYRVWQSLGFQVKKGETACIVTKLWKRKEIEKTEEDKKTGDERKVKDEVYRLCKSALFSREQVERI